MPRIILPYVCRVSPDTGYIIVPDVNNVILNLILECEEKFTSLSEAEQKEVTSSLDKAIDFYYYNKPRERNSDFLIDDITFDTSYYDDNDELCNMPLEELKKPMENLLEVIKKKINIKNTHKDDVYLRQLMHIGHHDYGF